MRRTIVLAVLAIALVLAGAWWVTSAREGDVRAAVPNAERPLPSKGADGVVATLDDSVERGGSTREESGARLAIEPSRADDAEATRTAPTRATLRGLVVGPDGRPVAGARVFAARRHPWGGAPLDSRQYEREGQGERRDSQTDADGRFVLADLEPGPARFAVRAAGFAPLDDDSLTLGAQAVDDLGEVRLEYGALLSGRVVDPSGRGVAGAELVRVDAGTGFIFSAPGPGQGALLATTDDAGAFTVDTLAYGPWKLRVLSSLHPEREFEGVTDAAHGAVSGLLLELEAGFSIAGRVLAEEGLEVRELTVRARPAGRPMIALGSGTTPWREADCDEHGGFVLNGLADGTTYTLRVRRRGGAQWAAHWLSDAVDAVLGERDVLLRALAFREILLRVVDEANGAALSEFEVEWTEQRGSGSSSDGISTDDERMVHDASTGIWRLKDVARPSAEAVLSLTVRKRGYAPATRSGLVFPASGPLDLNTLALRQLPTFAVRVVDDATSTPLEGATVFVSSEGAGAEDLHGLGYAGDAEQASSQAETDADGRAELERLDGRELSVWATHHEHVASLPRPLVLPTGEAPELELRLARGGRLEVRVVDARGEALAEAKVTGEELAPRDGAPATSESRDTGPRGTAEFEHLAPGSWRFTLSEPMSRANRSMFGVDDEEHGDVEDVAISEGGRAEITLVAAERGSIDGRVTESGRALPGATVHALLAQDVAENEIGVWYLMSRPKTRSDGSGRFAFAGLRTGELVLYVQHPTRAMAHRHPVLVRGGANTAHIDLPVCTVEGRVLGGSGRPIEGATVRAGSPQEDGTSEHNVWISFGSDEESYTLAGDGGPTPARTDERGRYSLRGVAHDVELVVRAEHPQHQRASSAVFRVAAGDTRTGVDLELLPAGSIEVLVRRADETPVVHWYVFAKRADDEAQHSQGPTDATGVARLEGLSPGTWKVHLASGDDEAKPETRTTEVRAGERARVEFVIP